MPMLEYPHAPVPDHPTRANLREAVETCRACDLWEGATQAVMGEGAAHASLMLVGEQPGDREDIEGHPFVGPAGGVLDRGLEEAGIARDDVYITNAVKHFGYKLRGKRRIHQKPDRWQVTACIPWLEAEIRVVKPQALVCLGAHIRIGRDRGHPIDSDLAELVTLTTHPSAILRTEDEGREQAMAMFVADLTAVGKWLSERHHG
jgi:uracil-DNA glycosylase family protein